MQIVDGKSELRNVQEKEQTETFRILDKEQREQYQKLERNPMDVEYINDGGTCMSQKKIAGQSGTGQRRVFSKRLTVYEIRERLQGGGEGEKVSTCRVGNR